MKVQTSIFIYFFVLKENIKKKNKKTLKNI